MTTGKKSIGTYTADNYLFCKACWNEGKGADCETTDMRLCHGDTIKRTARCDQCGLFIAGLKGIDETHCHANDCAGCGSCQGESDEAAWRRDYDREIADGLAADLKQQG